MKPDTKKRNALILLVGGLTAVNCSWQLQDYYQWAVIVFVGGAFMIIADSLIHIEVISRQEKEIARLQKRN